MDCDGFWKSQYHSTERRNSLMLIFTRYVRRTESCLGNSDLAYIGVGNPSCSRTIEYCRLGGVTVIVIVEDAVRCIVPALTQLLRYIQSTNPQGTKT